MYKFSKTKVNPWRKMRESMTPPPGVYPEDVFFGLVVALALLILFGGVAFLLIVEVATLAAYIFSAVLIIAGILFAWQAFGSISEIVTTPIVLFQSSWANMENRWDEKNRIEDA